MSVSSADMAKKPKRPHGPNCQAKVRAPKPYYADAHEPVHSADNGFSKEIDKPGARCHFVYHNSDYGSRPDKKPMAIKEMLN